MLEDYPLGFGLNLSPFVLYVAVLTAILYSFAFNHAVLHISCVLLTSKVYVQCMANIASLKIIGIDQN